MNHLVENVLDQVRGAWRFRWLALALAWLICLMGWAALMFIPDAYEASARVFVDTRTTLGQVTQGIAVESNVDTQIQRVRQALLGGPQLEKVAKEASLQSAGMTPQQRQSQLIKLRDSIQIVSTGTTNDKSGGLYAISYRDMNRSQALRVVDRLLNNFVENTIGGKREGSEQAQRFLVEQIQEYERRLSTAEARRADFKKQNVGLMPGAQGGYFTRLQAEMEGSSRAQSQLGIALRRREELERQLRGEQPILPSGGGPAITLSGPNASVSGNNDTATRIREAQARLDELLLRFTDKHPDVITLRNTLTELQARQQQEIEAVRRGDPGAAAGIGLNANPVFQNIQLDLNRTNVEIAALRGEISSHERTMAELRKLVNTAPGVEAEFAKLDRDYDVTNAQYKALVERLERARLSEQAEATGIVTFEVVDPPSAGFTPVSPNRKLLVGIILLAGLGAGGALAYLLQQLKPVFTTSRQLKEVTGLPVLGVVSMTWLEKHQAAARRGFFAYAGAVALLPLCAAMVLLAQNSLMQLLHRLTG